MFEQKMTETIMSPHITRSSISELEYLLGPPDSGLRDLLGPSGEEAERIEYNAFIALGTYYRHMKDPNKVGDLFQTYGPRFRHHPSFDHFDLLRYVNADLGSDWRSIFQRALDNCGSGSAGSCNLFADLVVYHFEHHEEDPKEREKWLSEARDAISKARAKEDYPKFYCTEGRLCALLGRFDEAEQLIQSAIDLEPSSRSDYVLRIGSYQYYLLMVQARRQIARAREEMDAQLTRIKEETDSQSARMKEEMDRYVQSAETENSKIQDSLIKNIEYLGLFAGIVSFVIGSLSLAASTAETSFPGAAGLIMVLFGTLLGVFSGFTFMLHGLREKRWLAPLIVFALSVAILAGGLILCFNV